MTAKGVDQVAAVDAEHVGGLCLRETSGAAAVLEHGSERRRDKAAQSGRRRGTLNDCRGSVVIVMDNFCRLKDAYARGNCVLSVRSSP